MSKTMYKVRIIHRDKSIGYLRFYTEKEAREYCKRQDLPTKYIGKVVLGHYKNGQWQERR